MSTDATYSIADLARLTGVNVRTIRYYLAQGLLPASGESGPGAHYGDGHRNRLLLTRRLQEQHLPLAEIRRRLAELTDEQVADLLAASDADEREAPQTSALDYVRSLLGSAAGPTAGGPATPAPSPSLPPPSHASIHPLVSEGAPAYAPPPPPAKAMPLRAALLRRLPDATAMPPRMPQMRDAPPAGPTDATPMPTGPQAHERSQWERLSLGPNVEIHIRRPLSRLEQRRVERLITIARQVLKEDTK